MDTIYLYIYHITKIFFFHVVLRFLQKKRISRALRRSNEKSAKDARFNKLNNKASLNTLALQFTIQNNVIFANIFEPPSASGAAMDNTWVE